MKILKSIYNLLFHFLGINLKVLLSLYNLPRFIKEIFIFKKKGGKINNIFPILYDYNDDAGNIRNHYFHQDLRVSSLLFKDRPSNHIDVGSRIDGFISSISIFMEVSVLDIRKLDLQKNNINFIQGDIMDHKFNSDQKFKSVSCLHTLEHFGLGRYNDKINPEGYLVGFKNLYSLLDNGGKMYVSFPISSVRRIEFNAHRVFHYKDILNWITKLNINDLKLISFDLIDDNSKLHINQDLDKVLNYINFGCGIYTFKKLL